LSGSARGSTSRLAGGPRPPDAVLFDRDGTLITETGYLVDPDRLVMVPGAAEAVARLNRAGIKVALVTNQSAVGRGWLTAAGLDAIHARLAEHLARAGAHLDAIYSCFEHPTEGVGAFRRESPRRKPAPGMLLEALAHLRVAPERAWVVGDGARDLIAASRAGCSGILVLTGKGAAERAATTSALGGAPPVLTDVTEAVDWLLRNDSRND